MFKYVDKLGQIMKIKSFHNVMDNIINIVGLCGSILIGASFVPQTYKTIKNGETKDLSYAFMFLNITSASLMCIYGFYYKIIPVIISNGSVTLNCLIILFYMYNTHAPSPRGEVESSSPLEIC